MFVIQMTKSYYAVVLHIDAYLINNTNLLFFLFFIFFSATQLASTLLIQWGLFTDS